MLEPKISLSLIGAPGGRGGSQASVRNADGDDVVIAASSGQNGALLCLRAAARLRRLADAFVALGGEKEPFKVTTQKKVNLKARKAGKEEEANLSPQSGSDLIAAERRRQQAVENWSADHDDKHTTGELIDASLCYIYASINLGHPAMKKPPREWPWSDEWWKPNHESEIPNLVKAGALLAAEIDRRLRMANKAPKE